jgi:hypothetical protein
MPEVLATVHSFTNGNTYEIRKGGDGAVYCSCPSWKFGRGKRCKHLEEYRRACAGVAVEHVDGAQLAFAAG